MTFINEGESDRGMRMLLGVLLLAVGWVLVSGVLGIVLITAGAVALGTGIVGWCPAYRCLAFPRERCPPDIARIVIRRAASENGTRGMVLDRDSTKATSRHHLAAECISLVRVLSWIE